MSLILVVPGLISLLLVLRGNVKTAFLWVYLPCLLCLPEEYAVRLPHLPPTSTAEFALVPIGVVGLYRLMKSGSYALMDLLVLLYTASIGLSEILHSAVLNDGIFASMEAFNSIVLAYAVGRTLIEPDLRLATVRRFVTLVLLDGPSGIWEWKMSQSPYGLFAQRFLGIDMPAYMHMREGHGRMGTVLGGGEIAGIAFSMTFGLNAWLVYLRRTRPSLDLGKILTKIEQYHLAEGLLVLYAFLTQSRGPLLALGASYLILQIPRFQQTRIMTVVVAVLLIGGYKAMSSYFSSYMSVTPGASVSEQQQSAIYRGLMNELYPPVAEKGGWTGYGVSGIPVIQGMKSIDNEYLLIHLAWGRLAYYSFILIVWENIRILLVRSWRLQASEDGAFIFSMLATMAVLWFTLLTVFLGGQLPQISFLLVGWAQSAAVPPENKGFSFRRVFS